MRTSGNSAENQTIEFGQRVRLAQGGLGDQHHVVGDVKHAAPRAFEVGIGGGGAKRPQHEPLDLLVNDRSHRRDVDSGIMVVGGNNAFQDATVDTKLWKF